MHWSDWSLPVALLVALCAPEAGRAERYVLSIGSLPPVIVQDSRTYTIQLEPERDMIPCSEALASQALPASAPAPDPVVPPAAPVPPDSTASGAVAPYDEAFARIATPSVDHEEVLNPPTPPTPAFDSFIRSTYSITDAADVQGAYMFYLKEPAGIPDVSRMSNALIRHILSLGVSPAGGSTARPDQLIAQPRAGTIRVGSGGLNVRQGKWGAPSGQLLPAGTALTIVPPAEEGWYHVRGPGGEGWVPGLWVDAQP